VRQVIVLSDLLLHEVHHYLGAQQVKGSLRPFRYTADSFGNHAGWQSPNERRHGAQSRDEMGRGSRICQEAL
jgi:hypothetical protein